MVEVFQAEGTLCTKNDLFQEKKVRNTIVKVKAIALHNPKTHHVIGSQVNTIF